MPSCRGFRFPRDLPLVMGSWAMVLRYTLDLWVLRKSLPGILGAIEARAEEARRPAEKEEMEDLDKLWRSCGFFLCRCLRSHRPCLRRALVLHSWARERGIDSRFYLGVRKEDSLLKSHAWLCFSGSPFREAREKIHEYRVMLEG